jgi:hypothetical protein
MAEMTPETAVRDQIDAYNGHDVGDFLSYYAGDAMIALRTAESSTRTVTTRCARVSARSLPACALRAVITVGEWVAIHSVVLRWPMPDSSVKERQSIDVYAA